MVSRLRSVSRLAVFIINPVAGGLPARRKLDAAIDEVCAASSIVPRTVLTEAPGHARQLAAEAEAEGAEIIVVCGGDGTLNEVINGLSGNDVTIGQVPGGTANVWAKEAGIARDPERALRAQFGVEPIMVDAGRAGERRFLLMASYGFDALAVAAVRPRLKRRVGMLAYLLAGFEAGLGYKGFDVALEFDGGPPEELHASMMVFGNTRVYGGLARMTPEASAVDGELDCVVFLGHGVLSRLRMVPTVLRGRHLLSERVLYRRSREVRIVPREGGALPPMQVDGDAEPEPAACVRLEAGALRMFVPKADEAVFRR